MIAELLAITPVILGLLAVSGVFSAAETSLTGASRGRMHQLERDGDRAARALRRITAAQMERVADRCDRGESRRHRRFHDDELPVTAFG